MSTIHGTNAKLYINGVAMEEDTEHIDRLIKSIERREEMGRECLERIAKRYLAALEKIASDDSIEYGGEWATAYRNLRYVALCAIRDGIGIREAFLNEMRQELEDVRVD